MKTKTLSVCLALASTFFAFQSVASAATDPSQPHLETRHGVRQLVVDGKPFLILGGELHNSSSSSRAYMKAIWPQLAQKNLNTVLAVITWELIEPQEGHFDFSTVDDTIAGARENHLKLVILWFGSWKNGESSYQPGWVKADPQRFPWAKDRAGKTLNNISTFGDATRDGDARAYGALMRHLREVDGKVHTVLAMQIENEVGLLGDSRDHVPAANEAFAKPVPKDLMNYVIQHKDTLGPELRQVRESNGSKTSGAWEEVFGPSKPETVIPLTQLSKEEYQTTWRHFNWPADELFMAWRYSTYINKVAAAGKAEYSIPTYCNTWLQQDREARPGEFPSGCPEPEVHDIWRFCAPNIDILAPDIYIPYFDEVCQRYMRNDNPLFIPEVGANASNALTAILKFNAICFSPFGIEGRGVGTGGAPVANLPPSSDPLAQTYAVLDYLAPDILDNQGKGTIVLLEPMSDTNAPPQILKMGDYTLTVRYRPDTNAGASSVAPNTSPARFVINSRPGEYVIVGKQMTVTFSPSQAERGNVILGSFDESLNLDGHWVAGRRLNGDETRNNINWPQIGPFGIYRYTVFQRQ